MSLEKLHVLRCFREFWCRSVPLFRSTNEVLICGAGQRPLQVRSQQEHRAEDQRPRHLDHTPRLPLLAHRGVAQIRGKHAFGLGWAARPRALRLRLLDTVDRLDRGGVRRMGVTGDQQVGSPRSAAVDLLDQFEAICGVSLAGHQRQQQATLGIDGRMVPVVTAQAVHGIVRITRLFLLEDEGPLLINLDFAGLRGKKPPVPGGVTPHVRPPRARIG